ncbi:folliculin-interacting protein 2 [Anabrus simplex]|uniref:folliculin-interacting protein 2 n=1 Tax=Anabrus simplex TaxID=316456 RepID=UPI0035A296FE
MALLNRLFPPKKKNPKQGYVSFGKNDSVSWKPFNFSKEQVRVLLFRECDARGRKLLFDSSTVKKTAMESQQCSKTKFGTRSKSDGSKKTETFIEITNGYGYQYMRPNSDVTLMREMIFGSVAMKFRGTMLKVHKMNSPDRLMYTKVFLAPVATHQSKRVSDQSLEDSYGSSLNSVSDYATGQVSSSDLKTGSTCGSGPLDVPFTAICRKVPTSSLEGDSGFCGDASLHSASSMGSSGLWGQYTTSTGSQSSSGSVLGSASCHSGGSLASLQRRWLRNRNTSLELGMGSSSGSFCTDEAGNNGRRKTQLGLTVIINLTPAEEKEMELFFFEHMAVIESIVERLRWTVEHAYIRKDMFVHIMMEGYQEVQEWLYDLFSAPRLSNPMWMCLMSPTKLAHNQTNRCNLATTFLRDLCQLIAVFDTKDTNFFVSTLITAVLTHHLGWVATVLPGKSSPHDICKAPCTTKLLSTLAKSHPYNVLWAQLGDLHGALGNPVRVARTIVTSSGKKNDLLNKLLSSLSYFIRCGYVERRVDCQVPSEEEKEDLNSVLDQLAFSDMKTSQSSTSTIVATEPPIKCVVCPESLPQSAVVEVAPKQNLLSSVSSKAKLIVNKGCEISVSSNYSTATLCDNQNMRSKTCSNLVALDCPNFSDRMESVETKSVGMKRCASFISKPDVSSEINRTRTEGLYPDIGQLMLEEKKEETKSFLHPNVISEKVSRLCRVPTTALLYHVRENQINIKSVEDLLPKKIESERQLSAVVLQNPKELFGASFHIPQLKGGVSPSDMKCTDQDRKSSVHNSMAEPKAEGVVFVLGDNEELVGLKDKSSITSESQTKLSSRNDDRCKSSCYPSLEELKCCHGVVHKPYCVHYKNELNVPRNDRDQEVSSSVPPDIDHCGHAFISTEDTCLDSGIVLDENCVSRQKSEWDGRTSKVVTARSSVIELEDECGRVEIKMNEIPKCSKPVVRSHSLSFPLHRSVTKRKNKICRRHSELIHENGRYLKAYHSVRFNFERCERVLWDYVKGTGMEKSPLMGKKSLKMNEARGNFEQQESCVVSSYPCDSCRELKPDSVLLGGGESDAYKLSITPATVCEDREGNALFDEYGRLSDEETVISNQHDGTGSVIGSVPDKTEEEEEKPLLMLPLPRCTNKEPSELGFGLAGSLLGGVADHYIPDLVLHGCTQPVQTWEKSLRRDLALTAHHPLLDQEVSEAVCIVGNVDLWEVQVVSSHTPALDSCGTLGIRVGMSQLVANMLESLMHLWRLKTPPDQCLQHLESKLRELCLRSQALAELLLTTEFCDLASLTSFLGLEANDVPLLLAVASTHTPQVTQHYGLTFR